MYSKNVLKEGDFQIPWYFIIIHFLYEIQITLTLLFVVNV